MIIKASKNYKFKFIYFVHSKITVIINVFQGEVIDLYLKEDKKALLGRAQPVIPPNLYLMLMNIIAWGPLVSRRDPH